MQTINIHSQSFDVTADYLDTLKDMETMRFKHIQEMLVYLFGSMDAVGVYTDEYALAIAVFFPQSKAWDTECRQGRCATDVRKYNGGQFKCQTEVPEDSIEHLDGGQRGRTTSDPEAVASAMAAITGQLS